MAQQTDHIVDINKMVTAVEWLARKIYFEGLDDEFVSQAKQMEKEQIINAYKFGLEDEFVIGSEKYYNQTYNV